MINSVEKIISEVFEMDEKDITDDHSPDSIEQWDSMNHLKLVTAIEDEYNIKFAMKEVQSMLTVNKIKETLQKHIVQV